MCIYDLSLTSIIGGIYYYYYVSVWKHYVKILLFGGKSTLKGIEYLPKSEKDKYCMISHFYVLPKKDKLRET